MKAPKLVLLLFSAAASLVAAIPVHELDASFHESTQDFNVTASLVERSRRVPVVLAMGNQKRNVGYMIGSNAYGTVYTALNALCPEDGHNCNSVGNIPIKVKASRNGYLVEDILYITAFRGRWGTKENKKLRSTMIGAIAAAAEKMTLDAKNCYRTEPHGTMCNMGDFIGIIVDDNNYMDIHFKGHGAKGHFDCVAVIEAVDNVLKETEHDYLEGLGAKDAYVERKTWCLNRDVTRDIN